MNSTGETVSTDWQQHLAPVDTDSPDVDVQPVSAPYPPTTFTLLSGSVRISGSSPRTVGGQLPPFAPPRGYANDRSLGPSKSRGSLVQRHNQQTDRRDKCHVYCLERTEAGEGQRAFYVAVPRHWIPLRSAAFPTMGGARIFAVWRQREGRAKGIGGKTGLSLGHLAIHGDMWRLLMAAGKGGCCPPC